MLGDKLTKKQERKQFLRSLSPSSRLSLLQSESEQKRLQDLETLRISSSGIPLVFDLSYSSSMSPSEINSMINQIRFSVGFLRKHSTQYFKLLCCNCSPDLTHILLKKGSASWKLDLYQEDITQLGLKSVEGREIVMLSPDADDILEEIDLGAVYVIGGLVDRTVKAKQTLDRARDIGVRTLRLPIKEEIGKLTNPYRLKKVLNMNTVVEALHYKASGDSWEQALLKSIPHRWLEEDKKNE